MQVNNQDTFLFLLQLLFYALFFCNIFPDIFVSLTCSSPTYTLQKIHSPKVSYYNNNSSSSKRIMKILAVLSLIIAVVGGKTRRVRKRGGAKVKYYKHMQIIFLIVFKKNKKNFSFEFGLFLFDDFVLLIMQLK